MIRLSRILVGILVSMCAAFLAAAQSAAPRIPFPEFGNANRWNRYQTKLTEVFRLDFESTAPALNILLPSVQLTQDPSEVIDGTASLKMSGNQPAFSISTSVLKLQPGRTYVVQFDYRVISGAEQLGFVRTVFLSTLGAIDGQTVMDVGGPLNLTSSPKLGTYSQSFRIPDKPGITVGLVGHQADFIIDNVRVLRSDSVSMPGTIQLLDSGFPRLMNYMLTDPTNIALQHDISVNDIERNLAGVDLILGTNSDFTLGSAGWTDRIRRSNPKIKILPYQQAFMTQYLDRTPFWGSAGLNSLFNRSLAPEWFLLDTKKQAVYSPDFPQNVQMNHTPYSPMIDGSSFNQHLVKYLQRSVLPGGGWEGFHFDQPEWYPNPLLADKSGKFPEMDADLDHKADSQQQLHESWKAGFVNFFRLVRESLGPNRLLFGNAGYIAQNPTMLGFLNGWLREILSPYEYNSVGDWQTGGAAGWYQIQDGYRMSMRYVQAPAISALQYTGAGLGQPRGRMTANGYPDRFPTLETRDFRRMRLGLTSTLLDDGYYEYDLVDNTTIPLWFDEYAVDERGAATRDLKGKGYMGQPLADASEIRTPERLVVQLDFESASQPAGIYTGVSPAITSDPNLVLSGQNSAVFWNKALNQSQFIAVTDPSLLPLEPRKTYEATMKYRILEYQGTSFEGFLAFGISLNGQPLARDRSSFQFLPDIDGPGQTGQLRVVAQIPDGKVGSLLAGFLDTGAVVVDDLRITEGGPGVWRRDFENAVVLVNPTPGSIYVSQDQIQGPLNRTGLRRIRGSQAPNWNSGAAVTSGITIPSADGIILLADPIPAAPLSMPTSVVTDERSAENLRVLWRATNGYPAGYIVRYGEDLINTTREAAVTRHHTDVQLTGLQPGTTYYLRVAAYDYRGNIGPFSGPVSVSTAGSGVSRPWFALSPATSGAAPGSFVTLEGSNLAGGPFTVPPGEPLPKQIGNTRVLVNGVEAALQSVSETHITFQMPWNVSGSSSFLHVWHDGVLSTEQQIPLDAAAPHLLIGDAGVAAARHLDTGSPVTDDNPALPGEEISVLAGGLGLVEPPPGDGELPTPGTRPAVANPVEVIVNGVSAAGQAILDPEQVGRYAVKFTVPLLQGLSRAQIALTTGGIRSGLAVLPVLDFGLSAQDSARESSPIK